MVIDILIFIGIIIMWFGLIMSSWSKPDEKKRQNGWLIAACATFFNGVLLFLIDTYVFCTILMFVASIVDFWTYDKCRKMYKELSIRKLSDARERFIKEITEYRF